jgi:hypothetical protein
MPRPGRKGDSCSHRPLADAATPSTTWGTSGGLEGARLPEFAQECRNRVSKIMNRDCPRKLDRFSMQKYRS